MLVEEVMSREVVSRDRSVSLREIAGAMIEERVGSVIVDDEGAPTGIVTETDLVRAVYVSERPFREISAEDVMSSPLLTVEPDTTLRKAIARMEAEAVKKLAVLDGMDLLGVVSLTDLAYHYGDLVEEIQAIEQAHGDWVADTDRFGSNG
jgi:CBS domain-containing protein